MTQFRYDRNDLILEMDGDDSIITNYTFGKGVDNPFQMHRGSSNFYYVKDGLGSVMALADSVGNVVYEYTYSVFGEIIGGSGEAVENPFTYTAREWEPEVNLYYYRARFYNAAIGRFISNDPIGFRRWNLNLYRYVLNNPLINYDPFGLNSWEFDRSDGRITQCDDNGNEINSWPATSGPWQNGALPTGPYDMNGPPVDVPEEHPNQDSYCDNNGNCWWQPITPDFDTDRDGLGIHPDGNVPGTAGCIGATDDNTQGLRDALTNHSGPVFVVE